ncbi:MAG: DUF4326 domain-containing protein [Flavobacteriaceae bacterium]|nr:DUF4326 domain-containing protein [Flavobacteriaceae bacterium]
MNQALFDYSRAEVATPGSTANELVSFVYIDRNCRLSLKTKDDRFKKFNSNMEFDSLIDFIENTTPVVNDIFRGIGESLDQRATNTLLVDVHNVDLKEWVKEENHIYIGRAHGDIEMSFWANEFKINDHGRDTALHMYESKVRNSPLMLDRLHELRGCSLGCWCAWPQKCHGQILIDLLSNLP